MVSAFRPEAREANVQRPVAENNLNHNSNFEEQRKEQSGVIKSENERVAETSSSHLPEMKITDSTKEKAAAKPVDQKQMERAADAIQEATNGGLTGIGTDKEKLFAVLKDKSPEEIKVIDEIFAKQYGEKYAEDGKRWGLRDEFKDELSGADLDKALSILDRKGNDKSDDAGRVHAALIERDNWIVGRSNATIEKDIRDTVSTMNSKQIAELDQEYRRRYGKGVSEDLMNDKNLSTETKEALQIYLKGTDKRTAQDTLKLADQALKAEDINRFQEVFRDAPQEVRAQFLKEGGESKIKAAFGAGSDEAKHAADYAKSGELSLQHKIESNTSWLGDNEKAIEASLGRMKDSERTQYARGKELQAAGSDSSKLSSADRDSLNYYKDVHTALEKAGSSSELARWEDMIAVKDGSLVSKLNEHKGLLYNDGKEKVLATVEGMSKSDWQYLKDNPQAVKAVKDSLSDLLSGDDLKIANASLDKRLAAETFEAAKPKSDKIDLSEAMKKHSSEWLPDKAQVIRDVQQAFKEDPTLKERIANPTNDADKELSAEIQSNLKTALGSSDYATFAKPLLETGHLAIDVQMELNRGAFNDDEQGFYKDILNANAQERARIFSDEKYQDKVLGSLSADERAVALNILMQGEMKPEDKLRAQMLGAGTGEKEIKDILSALSPEQKEQVKAAYAAKYGDLNADLVDEVGGQDKVEIQRLTAREPESAREAFNNARDQYYKSRDGIGSSFVDAAWDGTGYAADQAMNDFAKTISENSKRFSELPPEEQKRLQENLAASLDQFVESKGAAADAVVDATIGVAAVGGAVFTGGVSLSLLAATTAGGAMFKVGTKAALMGNDYDFNSSQVAVDFATGGVDAALNLVGPGQVAKVFKLGERAGIAAADSVLTNGGKALVKEGAEETFKDGVVTTIRHALANGSSQVDDKLIKEAVKKVAVEGQEDALAAALKTSLNQSIQNEARSALKATLTEVAMNGTAGSVGGGASGAIRGASDWDTNASVLSNLENVATTAGTSALLGGAGAAGFTAALKGAGKAVNELREASGQIAKGENTLTHAAAGDTVPRSGGTPHAGDGPQSNPGKPHIGEKPQDTLHQGEAPRTSTETPHTARDSQSLARTTDSPPSRPHDTHTETLDVHGKKNYKGEDIDVDGRPIQKDANGETFRDKTRAEWPDYPSEVKLKIQEQLDSEMSQAMLSDGRSLKQAFDDFKNKNPEFNESMIMDLTGQVREHYTAIGGAAQDGNWTHTMTEMRKAFEAVKNAEEAGLTPPSAREMEKSLIASMFSDSKKPPFHTHHIEGALAADHALERYIGNGLSQGDVSDIVKAIREHQVVPQKSIMSFLYGLQIAQSIGKDNEGVLKALEGKAAVGSLTEKETAHLAALKDHAEIQSLTGQKTPLTEEQAQRLKDLKTDFATNHPEYKLTTTVGTVVDNETGTDIINLKNKIANARTAEAEMGPDGGYHLVLTDGERKLLHERTGTPEWYVPKEGTPQFETSMRLIRDDALANYADEDGFSKLFGLRKPPAFGDINAAAAEDSIDRSWGEAKEWLTKEDIAVAEVSRAKAKQSLNTVYDEIDRDVIPKLAEKYGVSPEEMPYWRKRGADGNWEWSTKPLAGQDLEIAQAINQEISARLGQRTRVDGNQWGTFKPTPEAADHRAEKARSSSGKM